MTSDQSNIIRLNVPALLKGWGEFYREVFGLEVDFSNLSIPAHRDGFEHLIVVAKGLSIDQTYLKCGEFFPCYTNIDRSLDEVVSTNDRVPTETYAVWVRDRIEPDEEYRMRSANELERNRVNGITFLERCIMELKYYRETRNRLDQVNWTLCSGSRYDDGGVPRVGQCPSVFWVSFSRPDQLDFSAMTREVVS